MSNIGYYSSVPSVRQAELKQWIIAYENMETPLPFPPPKTVVEMGFVFAVLLQNCTPEDFKNNHLNINAAYYLDRVELAKKIAQAANEDNLF